MKFSLGLNSILLILSFVCFLAQTLISAFGGNTGRLNLMALGATFFVGAALF